VGKGLVIPCQAYERDKQARHERDRVITTANTLADAALANGTVLVSGADMDDIRRLIHGQPTSGMVGK
jgi:hypothetical protein